MQSKYDILQQKEQEDQQEAQAASQELAGMLETFLFPLLVVLDRYLDKRLVRTMVECCVAIIRFRNNKQGLLLSELGSYMDGYRGLSKSATAGAKRLGNLIRSIKWSLSHIDDYLLCEADKEVKNLRQKGNRVLCLWDGSVIEKPESSKLEGLGPVMSSKAKRLNRSRRGLIFNMPAAKPIMVTGMQWTGALIAGMEGVVKVAAMTWWTTKGDYASKQREVEEKMLRKIVRKWGGNILIHVFDRGYASGPWLKVLQSLNVIFVIRWINTHIFIDVNGNEKKIWQIGHGKKYLAHKSVYDTYTSQKMPCDIWWTEVRHPSYTQKLYLLKIRMKKEVSYIITNEPIKTEAQAWAVFFTYKRRWQIELCFRYGKCELAMESPRLWAFEDRLKLLGMVTLVYAFLLHLISPEYTELVQSVLRVKCHRTGKRCRDAIAPLYRLRWAITRLWSDHHPALGSLFAPNLQSIQALASLRC
jgi:Transposase DDE domain